MLKSFSPGLLILCALLVSGWVTAESTESGEQKFPDIVDVQVEHSGGNRFEFLVTVSSRYDSPERYADAFRVLAPDGRVFGVRELVHPHRGEQPFTRGLNVEIPEGVDTVMVQGRDQQYGYGGDTMEVELPGR